MQQRNEYRSSASRVAGFTLMELTIVLVISALLVGLALPALGNRLPGARLNAVVHELAAQARIARNLAVSQNAPVSLLLDVDERRYGLSSESRRRSLPAHLQLTFHAAAAERTGERGAAIRFYGDGSSTGGRIALRDGDRLRQVDVQWLTGKVSIIE